MSKIQFIYIVELDDKKTWAFKKKEDAVNLMENKLHMKKDKVGDSWGIKGYQNKAKLITLELK
jgi:hypothetical protein